MKHAFLIIAHRNWNQLVFLLKQLDDERNDIYIHIDSKVNNIPYKLINSSVKKSNIKVLKKYKVYWGSFELVQTELFLLKQAIKNHYSYYHLLSGADLMIKSKKYFFDFFEKNKGYEFISYASNQRLSNDKEILRRVKYYHFFTNYRRRFRKKIFNKFFDFIERFSLCIQILLGINRLKKTTKEIKYGSQWFSITDDCAKYIISCEDEIYKIFHKTKCADELFIQTLIYNSNFENKLFNRKYDGDCLANVRLIDIDERGKNGSPYIWCITDYPEIKKSKCIFARKFDFNVDSQIINEIMKETGNKNG